MSSCPLWNIFKVITVSPSPSHFFLWVTPSQTINSEIRKIRYAHFAKFNANEEHCFLDVLSVHFLTQHLLEIPKLGIPFTTLKLYHYLKMNDNEHAVHGNIFKFRNSVTTSLMKL